MRKWKPGLSSYSVLCLLFFSHSFPSQVIAIGGGGGAFVFGLLLVIFVVYVLLRPQRRGYSHITDPLANDHVPIQYDDRRAPRSHVDLESYLHETIGPTANEHVARKQRRGK